MAKKKNTRLESWQKVAAKGGQCDNCKVTMNRLTVDHIVPIHFIDCFDLEGMDKYNDEDNFQVLCSPCNYHKGNKFDKDNPKTAIIIAKYVYLKHSPVIFEGLEDFCEIQRQTDETLLKYTPPYIGDDLNAPKTTC